MSEVQAKNYLVNIGYGNLVNADKVVGIISPDAAPIKRLIQTAKDQGTAYDATCGRKTKSVILLENGNIMLSSLLPDTIRIRVNLED